MIREEQKEKKQDTEEASERERESFGEKEAFPKGLQSVAE